MAALGAVLAAVLGGVALTYVWAFSAADPARTLALAARLLDRPVPLESALDVNWSRSTAPGGGAPWRGSLDLLESPPPPALCLDPAARPAPSEVDAAEVDRAVRALDAALERGSPAELDERITGLLRLADVSPASAAAFVIDYNLARGYLAARDEASAARALEPVFDDRSGYLSRDRLPPTDLAGAARRIRAGDADAASAARGFYARFLAGAIAYDRGEMPRAISHFRLALNALNYVVAARDAFSFYSPRGHHERFEVPLREPCAGGRPGAAMTSLDGYAALVRAYLAADGFRDADGIAREVRRGRFDMDANDPFAPLLRYARAAGAAGLARGPIPENFIWAASNLQRVYHHNQRDPDPRLEVARGVLVLRLVDRPEWLRALEPHGGGDPCRLLVRVASDLADDGRALAASPAARPSPDSALAAVAVHIFARARRRCGGEATSPRVGAAVRSAWLRLGGRFLGGGLAGRYEVHRRAIVDALASANAPAAVIAERVRKPVREVRGHLEYFESGRTPPTLPAAIDPGDGESFVHDWWRAVFLDVANELSAAVRGGGAGPPLRLPAAQADEFLAAVDGAIAHAGVRPSEVYALREFEPFARSLGFMAGMRYGIRYRIRSHPVLAALGLGALGLALAAAAVAVHVSVWRFRLLTRYRLYHAELTAREEAERA